ncbi:hypothetical protein, partial [Methanoculleus chikugoensis]|uniref:hypothetical protein n=1 Tax=Methanoculleus chikugoensis TaxID=118126 RepID=UPI000A60350C
MRSPRNRRRGTGGENVCASRHSQTASITASAVAITLAAPTSTTTGGFVIFHRSTTVSRSRRRTVQTIGGCGCAVNRSSCSAQTTPWSSNLPTSSMTIRSVSRGSGGA